LLRSLSVVLDRAVLRTGTGFTGLSRDIDIAGSVGRQVVGVIIGETTVEAGDPPLHAYRAVADGGVVVRGAETVAVSGDINTSGWVENHIGGVVIQIVVVDSPLLGSCRVVFDRDVIRHVL
jgi:hypothetical protein